MLGTTRRNWPEEEQDHEEDYNEASYPAFEDESTPEYHQHPEADGEDHADYEFPSPKQSP